MNILCIKKVLCDMVWLLGYKHKNTLLRVNQYHTESYLANIELV